MLKKTHTVTDILMGASDADESDIEIMNKVRCFTTSYTYKCILTYVV